MTEVLTVQSHKGEPESVQFQVQPQVNQAYQQSRPYHDSPPYQPPPPGARRYLSNSHQNQKPSDKIKTRMGTTKSSGISQGGSLSCLLFSIFANNMSLHVPDVTIVEFADDTQLLVSRRKADMASLISRMESALSTLFTWSCSNDMEIKAGKIQMTVLGTRQMLKGLPSVSIRFAGTIVLRLQRSKT